MNAILNNEQKTLGNYILGINGYRSIQYHAYLGLLKVRSEVNVS